MKLFNNLKLLKKENCILLVLFIFLLGINFIFAQKEFYMKEKKIYEKFKIARKYFEEGKKLFRDGKYTRAEKELNKCIEVLPQHVYGQFYLSKIIYKKGDYQKALDHLEKAKANFDYMAGLYSYAYQDYIDQLREEKDRLDMELLDNKATLSKTTAPEAKQQLEMAIGTLEQRIGVIKIRLNEPLPEEESMPADFYFFHGNILFKLEKYQDAYREYFEAIKVDPKHGDAYNNLANLYFMAKEYQKALDCLNKAEEHDAKINPKFKKAILKALDK